MDEKTGWSGRLVCFLASVFFFVIPYHQYELSSKLRKGGCKGEDIGTTIGVPKGDARS